MTGPFFSGSAVCLFGLWVGVAAASPPSDLNWTVRLPQQETVVFKGQASYENAAQPGGAMMYPAPNLAGLLVGIATHGALVSSARDSRRAAIEAEADKVLLPYADVLKAYKYSDLMQHALQNSAYGQSRKLVGSSETAGEAWLIDSAPVFFMTQDQSALVLENTLALYSPGQPKQAAYQNTVRVVSAAQEHGDPSAFWTADEGKALKQASASLLQRSMEIALAQATATAQAEGRAQTVRYQEGKKEVVERAQMLHEHCGRALIKNLRGWLMSIPLRARPADASCEAKDAF